MNFTSDEKVEGAIGAWVKENERKDTLKQNPYFGKPLPARNSIEPARRHVISGMTRVLSAESKVLHR